MDQQQRKIDISVQSADKNRGLDFSCRKTTEKYLGACGIALLPLKMRNKGKKCPNSQTNRAVIKLAVRFLFLLRIFFIVSFEEFSYLVNGVR